MSLEADAPRPRDLGRLLRPRSIAVVGGRWAETVVRKAQAIGFRGAIWPVHPGRATIAGLPAFPGIDALPAAPDAAFVGVNRHASVGIVGALAAQGAGGAVAFASGWAEAGAPGLQAELVVAAGAMPLLGPNCYGLVNYLDGVALWPGEHGGAPVERGVALVSQSSNIAINLTMQRRGLPVACVACLGNAAQIGLVELGAALLADPRITALGVYAEAIGDAAGFAALVASARASGRGVAVLMPGRTEAARGAAASHTAALSGDGAGTSALLAQCGAAEVATLEELVETLKVLHLHGPLAARRFCALSCSGGEAALVADLAAKRGIGLPPPEAALASRLAGLLGPLVRIANPLDYHTFIWGDAAATGDVFAAMLADYDAGIFVIDMPREDRCDPSSYRPALDAIAAAARRTGRPAFALASLPENLPEPLAERLLGTGVVPLAGLEAGLAALVAAAVPAGAPGWVPWPARPVPAGRLVDEAAAKALLAAAGIAVPRGAVAALPGEIALGGLVPPLALKGLGIAHKTEAGAVRLGLTAAEVAAHPPMPGATGHLAEEMVTGAAAELLVGVARDPVLGVRVTIGVGGTAAEVLADTVTLVAPVTGDDIAAALRRLRLWPLLDGHRGRPRPDLAAAIRAVLAVQALVRSREALLEVEINPLILTPDRAVAADALIRTEEP